MTMRVTPLMICRTKYVDYNDPVFCAAPDLDVDLQKKLHDIIINGNNLKFANECKVFISDSTHVVIGKVVYIKKLFLTIDDSLDKESDGRSAWGFIGGSINRSEYVDSGQLLDLPDDFYKNVYTHCLYENHWRELDFHGPYVFEPFDVNMVLLNDTSEHFVEGAIPIYPDKFNNTIFLLAVKKTLKGGKVSFCSNEEFNAANAINKKALTFATVSEDNIKDQIESLKKSNNVTSYSQYDTRYRPNNSSSFIDDLNSLCRKYNYSFPQKKSYKQGNYIISGYFIETEAVEAPEEKSWLDKILGC